MIIWLALRVSIAPCSFPGDVSVHTWDLLVQPSCQSSAVWGYLLFCDLLDFTCWNKRKGRVHHCPRGFFTFGKESRKVQFVSHIFDSERTFVIVYPHQHRQKHMPHFHFEISSLTFLSLFVATGTALNFNSAIFLCVFAKKKNAFGLRVHLA